MTQVFTMGSGGVPTGSYQGVFVGLQPFEGGQSDFGPAVLLRWKVIGGQHDGCETTRICSASLSPKSNLGKFAVALAGRPIAPGESVQFESFAGVTGSLLVEDTPSGMGTRVAAFIRGPVAQPQPTAYQAPQPQAPQQQWPQQQPVAPQGQWPAQAPAGPQASPQAPFAELQRQAAERF